MCSHYFDLGFKREAKAHLLPSLRYDIFNSKQEICQEEKEIEIQDLDQLSLNSPEYVFIGIRWIELASWGSKSRIYLYNPMKKCLTSGRYPNCWNISGWCFVLFTNNSGLSGYTYCQIYISGSNKSVMSHARADALFTTFLYFLSL